MLRSCPCCGTLSTDVALHHGLQVLYSDRPHASPELAIVVSDGVLSAAEGSATAVLHDVRLVGSGRTLFDVPASRLRDVDSATNATQRKARHDAAAAAARCEADAAPPSPSLAPPPSRLAQVATAAAEAMRSISNRTPCAICCCSVQEADSVAVSVSEGPEPRWLEKLKVCVHPALRVLSCAVAGRHCATDAWTPAVAQRHVSRTFRRESLLTARTGMLSRTPYVVAR